MKISRISASITAVVGLCAAGAPASANVLLRYTGLPFWGTPDPAAGTAITGYVVLKDFSTVAAGKEAETPDLLDWSLSNGAYTLSKAGGNALLTFDMQIAQGGLVTRWSFDAQDTGDANWTKFSRTDSGYFDISIVKDNSYSGESENVGPSGTWSYANSVPEPQTWALTILGFGLGGAAIRRAGARDARKVVA